MQSWNEGQKKIIQALKKNTAFSANKHGQLLDEIALKAGSIDAAEWFKFQAFSTSVVEDEKLRLRIKAALAGALKRGETYDQFIKNLLGSFDKFKEENIQKLSNVFETQQALAFGAAQQAKLMEVSEDFPYWQYSAIHDARTRPEHMALDGKIFSTSDMRFYPPIGFRCRCTAIPLTASQAGRINPNLFIHPKQAMNEPLANSEFVGNKQQNFVKWLKERADKSEPQTQELLVKGIERLQQSIDNKLVNVAKGIYHEPGVEKESEFQSNLKVAKVLNEKWKTNITLVKANPKLPSNYDAVIFNKSFEFKDINTNKFNTIDSHLRKAKNQAKNVVLTVGTNVMFDTFLNAFESRFKDSKSWNTITIIKADKILMIKRKGMKWNEVQRKIKGFL